MAGMKKSEGMEPAGPNGVKECDLNVKKVQFDWRQLTNQHAIYENNAVLPWLYSHGYC